MTSAVSRISNAAPCSGPTKFCRSNLLNLVFRRSAVSIIHSCLSVCLECCCCTLLWLHKILQVQLAKPCFVLQSATVSLFTLSVSMSEYCSLLWLHKIMQVQLCSVSRTQLFLLFTLSVIMSSRMLHSSLAPQNHTGPTGSTLFCSLKLNCFYLFTVSVIMSSRVLHPSLD